MNTSKYSHVLAAIALTLLCVSTFSTSRALAGQETDYTDPTQMSVPFGDSTAWAQPWRATLTTIPTVSFLGGIGINLTDQTNPNLEIEHLALHGFKRIRIEIGWNSLDYATATQLIDAPKLTSILVACKTYGVRPLILLNADAGAPCPNEMFTSKVAVAAPAGARAVTLNSTSGLIPGYSGISNLSGYVAAQAFIISISGNTVTLSQPLPVALSAGQTVSMATLKYQPFSVPGSANNAATIAGWQNYVKVVATFVYNTMNSSTGQASSTPNPGFDFEVWNELSFGSQFLSVNNYYNPSVATYNQDSIWGELTAATTAVATANPTIFNGVGISDGFANTDPFPAASTEPAGITAISKHPYAGAFDFPYSDWADTPLNAQLHVDMTGWQPTYTAFLPEYFGTFIQTESIMRDISSITTTLNGTAHGRLSRSTPTSPSSIPVWISEAGIAPNSYNPSIDATTAMYVKAKIALRYYAFYLGEGVGLVTLYNDDAGDTDFGLVSDAFISFESSPNATYPTNDSSLTSPTLEAVGNMAKVMGQSVDTGVGSASEPVRSLQITSVADTANYTQFAGDGTTAHPPLYDRDVLAFLPTEVNAHRFAVPYYVITRDVFHVYNSAATEGHQFDLPAETFTLSITGVNPAGISVSAYDPIQNSTVAVPTPVQTGTNSVNVTVTAVDYPRILIIQEGSVPAAPSALTATSGNAQVSLSWTSGNGATSYNVYRGTSAGNEAAMPVATDVTTLSYTDSGLTNGTTYFYKVASVDASGTSSFTNEASATPIGGGAAYHGPHNIPGTVEAEDYDTGGQGVAYNQTENGHQTGYRADNDTAVQSLYGDSNGYNLAYTTSGQWTKYTVNVSQAGTYTVTFRIASPSGVTGAFSLETSSGVNLTGNVTVAKTGSYSAWQTVTASAYLGAGQQTLTLKQNAGGWNIDNVTFAR